MSWNIGGEGGNSFPFDNLGDHVRGTLLDFAEVQRTDPKDGKPMFWESNGDPMMQYRVTLQTELRNPQDPSDDGKRTVYLRGRRKLNDDGTMSSLCATLEAVKAATGGGTDMEYGADYCLQFSGEIPSSQRGLSAAKTWSAWYTRPPMGLVPPGQQAPPPQQQATPGLQANQWQQPQAQYPQPPQGQPQQPPTAPPQQQRPNTPPPAPNPAQGQQGPPPAGPGGPGSGWPPPQGQAPQWAQQEPPTQDPWAVPNDPWANNNTAPETLAPQQPTAPPVQPHPVAPPAQSSAAPAAAGQSITRAQVASIQAIPADPAAIFGPDWESRVVD